MYEKRKKGTLKDGSQNKNDYAPNFREQKNDSVKDNNFKDLNNDLDNAENKELKSLIASYVDEALKNAKSEWDEDMKSRIAAERDDAAKLATMSAEERAQFEMERRVKDFETEREQYINERAEFEAAKELAAQNLPVNFAKMVADADKETMTKNIAAFKAEYLKAIEEGLSQRLKGTLPKVSKEKEQTGDPFLNGLGF